MFNIAHGEDLLEGLNNRGWFASPELVPRAIADQLYEQIQIHKKNNSLKPAHIGQGENKKARPDIRGDSILWLEPENETPLEKEFHQWLSSLMNYLNEHLHLGLKKQELHYAVYPAGGLYQKHKDVFEKNDERVLSFVLYLNKDWKEENGGQIAIYKEEDSDAIDATISPTYAQCVIFLSGSIFHEVIFTKAERNSVTGWLKKTASEADFRAF